MTATRPFKLEEALVRTGVARPGMSVRDVFRDCVTHNVPGIPFCDGQGELVGRVSIRHVLKLTCVPGFMVKGAHLLGDVVEAVRIPDVLARGLLDLAIDEFVLEPVAIVSSAAPVVKALAMMEHFNSAYAFVIDDGEYKGLVTRMGIASLMLEQSGA